jgi:hypothetical protein
MTAVTADNTTAIKSKALDFEGFKADYEVAASTVIYKNTFVGLNATGYLTSYVAPSTATTQTGTSFRGIALEHVASQSADGAKRCKVLTSGYFEYTLTCDRVDIGCPVNVADNATLNFAASGGHCIGYVVAVEPTTKVIVRLDPFAMWSGNYLHVVTPPIDCTQTSLCMMVHETDNPSGLILCRCAGFNTEAHMCTGAAGVITIGHTTGTVTTMGCTLTCVDNDPISDMVVAVGGQLFADNSTGPATGDAIVPAPAGKAVIAKVTTSSDEGTSEAGMIQLFATFVTK